MLVTRCRSHLAGEEASRLLLAAQQFSTGLGLRASCQHTAEKALGGGRSRDYGPPPFASRSRVYQSPDRSSMGSLTAGCHWHR
jgi:hypothetical protein